MKRKHLPHVAGVAAAGGAAAGHVLHVGPYVLHFLDYVVGYHVLQETIRMFVEVPIPYVLVVGCLASITVVLWRKLGHREE